MNKGTIIKSISSSGTLFLNKKKESTEDMISINISFLIVIINKIDI